VNSKFFLVSLSFNFEMSVNIKISVFIQIQSAVRWKFNSNAHTLSNCVAEQGAKVTAGDNVNGKMSQQCIT